MEKTFSGQKLVFLRLWRQHPFLRKTKGPTRNPISPTPPPPPPFGGRPYHPPPPPWQRNFQVAQERAVSWATWLKTEFRGHLIHPQPPTFCGFQSLESPNKMPTPPYQWSLGGAIGQLGPRTVGANGGSTRVPGAKKIIFSKVVPRPCRMLKQVFLAQFEPVVTHFGPWKIPKTLENGPFWDQKWVKNGSKMRFSKSNHGPFGVHKQSVFSPF